ncbi:MAG TPA: TonB-dependent receptor, partial [Gemmatimonadales bacterium]|nr:TonB-dependent receptor [Gemmatimonadales bacterium]
QPLRSEGARLRVLGLVLGVLASVSVAARAQTQGAIRGTVWLAAGSPAVRAAVSLGGTVLHTTTDTAGHFILGGVPAGHYEVVAALEGRNAGVARVTLRGGDTVTVSITLGGPVQLGAVTVTAERVPSYASDTASVGSKMPVPLRDLPQTVTIVPEEVIRDRNVTTFRDIADNASGVIAMAGYTGYGLNEGSYIIRGFATSYTQTGLRDGFRDFAGVTPRDMVSVQQVEFLKGPSSVLYGATGALGGVPNTVTKKPTSTRIAEIGTSVDQFGMARATVDLGGPVNQDSTVRYRINGALENSRNFRPFDNGSYGVSLVPSLQLSLGAKTTVLASGEYTRREYRIDPYMGFDSATFALPTDVYYGEPALALGIAAGFRGQLVIAHQFGPGVRLHAAASALGGTLDNTSVSLGTVIPPDADHAAMTVLRSSSVNHEGSRDYAVQTELQVDRRAFGLRHRALIGVEVSRETYFVDFTLGGLDSIDFYNPVYGATPTDGPPISAKHPEDAVGVYVQDLVDLGSRVKVMVGARYDVNTTKQYVEATVFDLSGVAAEQTTHHVTPRAGLVYQPTQHLSLYAGWSTSFFPNLSCLACGDPYFPPEHGEQFEGGARIETARGRLTMNAAAYQIRKTNVTEGIPGDTLGRSFLSAEQRSRGAELDVQGEPVNGWNLILTYAYTDAREVHTVDSTVPANARLPGVPLHMGSLWSTYTLQSGGLRGLTLGGGVYAWSESETTLPNTLRLPGWHRVDLMAGYGVGRWRFQANVVNVTDQKYYDGQTAFNLALAPRSSRTLSGQVSLRL